MASTKFFLIAALIASVSLTSVARAAGGAPPPEVELITDGDMLQPSSTIEVRFSRPVIAREALNGDAAETPVVFTPALPGRFVWLSRQTGVYSPENTPPLGVEYVISLRPGLTAADGKPIGAAFRARLRTPAFGVSAVRNGEDEENVSPRPAIKIGFNAAVELKGAEHLFSFVDEQGEKVAAEVRHAKPEDRFRLKAQEDDWNERWELARHPKPELTTPDEEEGEAAVEGDKPLLNRIVVSPAGNLAPRKKWRLEIAPGLSSASGQYRITEPTSAHLGLVKPFVLNTVTVASYINSGRMVTLEFSRPIAPDVSVPSGIKFFKITPTVPNLRMEEGWDTLVLRGDFERGKPYELAIDPAVISAEGLPLEENQPRKFELPPVKPRLYLSQITGHQIRAGNRKFEVLSANLKSLQITARVVGPADAPRAIDAFSKYDRDPGAQGDPDEMYQKLPDGAIKGKVIAQRTIPVAESNVDARQKTVMDWDQVVGSGVAGVVFLTVEGEPLEAVGGKRCGAQALVQLTDLGVLWKKLGGELRLFVFSHKTGLGIAGARTALIDEKFAPLGTRNTDSTGSVALPVSAVPTWLVVQQGDDVHALKMGPSAEELSMPNAIPMAYRDWDADPKEQSVSRALVFTDRPLYQPGEEAKVKGIVRRMTTRGLEPDANREGALVLFNPRGDQLTELKIKTDERGSFDAAVSLNGLSSGRHNLQFKLALSEGETRDVSSCSFEVAAYQPNAFALDVPVPKRLRPEEPLRVPVTGKYFFGAAISKAQAKWTLRYLREAFSPSGFMTFRFGRIEENKENALTLRGEGSLTAAGPFVVTPKVPTPTGVPRQGVLTVEVTDINQQTVTDTQRFIHDATDFYLGIAEPERSVIRPGNEMPVRAVAVQPSGEPASQPVDVKAELIRLRHETVRLQGAGNAITFRTDTIEDKIAEAAGHTVGVEKSGESWRPVDDRTAVFKPDAAGQYRLRVTAKDGSGREVVSESEFYVSGPDEATWDYRNNAQVELVSDKTEYQAGDTARVLVKTPITGQAIVTIERDEQVLRTTRVSLDGNAPSIEVPISSGDAPNIFVSMVVIRGSEASNRKFKVPEYRYGTCMLRVSNPSDRLQVSVTPLHPEVRPGDQVETEISVHDGKGAAVENAEVTFFAVDDGVLALTGYSRPMPQDIFEEPLPLATKTGITLSQLMPEDPAELEFSNKGYLIGGGGSEGPGVKLRRDFPGTACWLPQLRTGPDGKVMARFRAPDALTRYRLVAVAHARSALFGSDESAFTIRKPLMLMPAVGQFGNVGDELIARAVVRNDTAIAGAVEVKLELGATAESAKPTTARVEVPVGEARSVDFPVRFVKPGDAQWKWTADLQSSGKQFQDSVVSTVIVGSPMLTLRETYLADARDKTTDLLSGVNPQVLEGSGSVAVTVANTRLASLRGSVSHLREYPYGCAEQTVSALIPWVVLPDLRPVLPELTTAGAEAAIRTGLDKIASMQTSSGGLAFWPGGNRPDLFPSAYAAVAFALLEHQGTPVPKTRDKLLDYLSGELRGLNKLRDETALGERALALCALAASGKAEPAYHEELFRRRAELSHESRALLAMAMLESGGSASAVAELLDVHKPAPEAFSWYGGGAARETAIELMAWIRFKPRAPEVARLTNELLAFRRNGRWSTTQENAWALIALSQYYTKIERGGGAAQGALMFGTTAAPFSVTSEHPSKTQRFSFERANPLTALRVENSSPKAPVFTDVQFVVHPPVGQQPRQDRGFSVARSYSKLGDDGSLGEAGDLKVGDRVLVTLRIEAARPARFVAIDDPLPAIFEAVNPAFVSRGVAGAENAETDWVSDYREMRADRVVIFCDSLPSGAFTFRYLARVRSAGSVTAPSAKAEEMYHPERFGLCESVRVSSRAE